MPYYTYILASQKNGTLYIGVTNDLSKRVAQHKVKSVSGFTQKYNVSRLVYVKLFQTSREAILYEKRLKKWNRVWKLRLIESINPSWDDLFVTGI
ncbi:MAG: GIY-YIG nuclease family protein [Epsilonproteobacteria bacterium]|nr:GIY-YIG nuclease family protein [Campylobacterota bacterium]